MEPFSPGQADPGVFLRVTLRKLSGARIKKTHCTLLIIILLNFGTNSPTQDGLGIS